MKSPYLPDDAIDAQNDAPCEYHYVNSVSTEKEPTSARISNNTMLKGEVPGHMSIKKSAGKMMVGAEDTKLSPASVSRICRTGFKLMLTLAGAAHCSVLSN